MADELRQMLHRLGDRGSPRGAGPVLDGARHDAGLLARADSTRPSWHRNVFAFAVGAVGIFIALGAVLIIRNGPASEITATDPRPSATSPTSAPATSDQDSTTTIAPSTTTVASSTTLAAAVAEISWERIDAPGAFDLRAPMWADDGTMYGGQAIRAFLAFPSCPDCDDVAGYLAGGSVGIQPTQWDARIWMSNDGITWSAVDGPGLAAAGSQTITAFSTDGNRIVAAGIAVNDPYFPTATDRARIWISDDGGATWVLVESPALDIEHGRIHDLAWTGSGFIAAGSEFWYSEDGSTWEVSTDLGSSELVNTVTPHGDGWIAVGASVGGYEWESSRIGIWASDDGLEWSPVHPDSEDGSELFAVMAGQQGLVATGFLQVWTSADGSIWQRVPWDPGPISGIGDMPGLALLGDWVISIGGEALMWASPDGGATWVRVPLDPGFFDSQHDTFGTIEVTRFPAEGSSPRLVVAGSHRGKAAIWIGTLER